jgi:hypothetical protein
MVTMAPPMSVRMSPYFCIARAMVRAAGLYSAFTSNDGFSRKRCPSQGMSLPVPLPSSRFAGQEKQFAWGKGL